MLQTSVKTITGTVLFLRHAKIKPDSTETAINPQERNRNRVTQPRNIYRLAHRDIKKQAKEKQNYRTLKEHMKMFSN